MSKWQPIETLPCVYTHNGIPPYVLLATRHHVGVGYRCVPNYPGDPELCDEHGEFIEPQPTHWQPLPEPPNPQGNAPHERD
jgi:hypothetical protein